MTREDDVAQSPVPTKPAPLPWSAGQGLAYFQKPFHTCVKGGWWSRSMTPDVGEGREGWPVGHVYGQPTIQVLQTASSMQWRSSSPPINTPHISLDVEV
jgi:hypothetical protein